MSTSTNPQCKLDAHHIVGIRMAQFWDEHGIESYKASHRDGVIAARDALVEAGFQLDPDTEGYLLDAADNAGYALGQFGVDWANDAQYHTVIAAILLNDGDV